MATTSSKVEGIIKPTTRCGLSKINGKYYKRDFVSQRNVQIGSNQETIKVNKSNISISQKHVFEILVPILIYIFRFITNYGFVINILDDGFRTGVQGYVTAKLHSDSANMEYFEGECQNFSKVGLQLTKVISERDSIFTNDWKERNSHFEQWIMQNDQGFQLGGFKLK